MNGVSFSASNIALSKTLRYWTTTFTTSIKTTETPARIVTTETDVVTVSSTIRTISFKWITVCEYFSKRSSVPAGTALLESGVTGAPDIEHYPAENEITTSTSTSQPYELRRSQIDDHDECRPLRRRKKCRYLPTLYGQFSTGHNHKQEVGQIHLSTSAFRIEIVSMDSPIKLYQKTMFVCKVPVYLKRATIHGLCTKIS